MRRAQTRGRGQVVGVDEPAGKPLRFVPIVVEDLASQLGPAEGAIEAPRQATRECVEHRGMARGSAPEHEARRVGQTPGGDVELPLGVVAVGGDLIPPEADDGELEGRQQLIGVGRAIVGGDGDEDEGDDSSRPRRRRTRAVILRTSSGAGWSRSGIALRGRSGPNSARRPRCRPTPPASGLRTGRDSPDAPGPG